MVLELLDDIQSHLMLALIHVAGLVYGVVGMKEGAVHLLTPADSWLGGLVNLAAASGIPATVGAVLVALVGILVILLGAGMVVGTIQSLVTRW